MRASPSALLVFVVVATAASATPSCTAFSAGSSNTNNNNNNDNTGDASVSSPLNDGGAVDANGDASAAGPCTNDDFATSFEAANYDEGWDDMFHYPPGDVKITLGPSTAERHSGARSFEVKLTNHSTPRGYALLHNLKSPGTACVDLSFWLHITTAPTAFLLIASIEFETNPHTSLQVAVDGNQIGIQEQSLKPSGELVDQHGLSEFSTFVPTKQWTRIHVRYEKATTTVVFGVDADEKTIPYTFGHDKAARIALGSGYADAKTSGLIHIDDVALK